MADTPQTHARDFNAPPSFYQDPTALTDKAIDKSQILFLEKINALKELSEARLSALDAALKESVRVTDRHIDIARHDAVAMLETRIDAMDKAVILSQQQFSDQLSQLKQLHQEKFDSISVQFQERDTRTEQTAAGVKIAVDAALQAAKEAVAEQNRSFALATGKSETATMKQIDALGLAIQTANKGLDDKIADMKDRLTRIEGMDLGAMRTRGQQTDERTGQHGANQNIIAIIAAIVAAVALAAVLFRNPAPAPVSVPAVPLTQRQSWQAPPTLAAFGLRLGGYESVP